MAQVTALFFDLGGVVLTNGWDRHSRHAAAQKFHLDEQEFEDRHELLLHGFEVGDVSLDEYLDRVIFYCPRPFSRDEFRDFLYAQSQLLPGTFDLLRRLAASKRFLMSALNNESRDLNAYRIEEFHLRECFDIFLSSCYLGVRKPDAAIYELALSITQRRAQECVFVDDRGLNLEAARDLGITTIQFQNAAQLETDLRRAGVTAESP